MAFFEVNVILQAFGVQDPVKKMKFPQTYSNKSAEKERVVR